MTETASQAAKDRVEEEKGPKRKEMCRGGAGRGRAGEGRLAGKLRAFRFAVTGDGERSTTSGIFSKVERETDGVRTFSVSPLRVRPRRNSAAARPLPRIHARVVRQRRVGTCTC